MITLRTTQRPSFKAEIAGLQPQAVAWVEHMLAVSVSAVDAGTPLDHGHLKRWLVQTSGVRSYGARVVGGVGPKDGLDIDESGSGKNYIGQFVDWYVKTNGKRPSGQAGKLAWRGLSPGQKEALYQFRVGGLYGTVNPPKYYGAIEEGKVPGTAKNVGFMRRIRSKVTTAFNAAKFGGGRASVGLG